MEEKITTIEGEKIVVVKKWSLKRKVWTGVVVAVVVAVATAAALALKGDSSDGGTGTTGSDVI